MHQPHSLNVRRDAQMGLAGVGLMAVHGDVVVVDADRAQVERLILRRQARRQARVRLVGPQEVVRRVVVDEGLELEVDVLAGSLVEGGAAILQELVRLRVLPAREVVRRGRRPRSTRSAL